MDRKPSTTRPGGPPLVILGASCRAAAESAAAAGWAVYAADLFADRDLAATAAATRRVKDYPASLAAAAAEFPACPWCYTGGLENHPSILDRIAACRPLAGNPGAVVRRARDPDVLAGVVRDAGLLFPATLRTTEGVPVDGSFITKPLAGAGGRGIRVWTAGPLAAGWIVQRRVVGEPLAAVFVVTDGGARLLGASRQLVGEPWCRAAAFSYCGSIRMREAELPQTVVEQLRRLGAALIGLGLTGVVGVDTVVRRDGRVAVIEVNPRPTASAELAERASGEPFMAAHLAAFGLGSTAPACAAGRDTIWSKAVLFAADAVTIDGRAGDRLDACSGRWSAEDGRAALADLPRGGVRVPAGGPLVTVFARGDSAGESIARLRARVTEVQAITG